MSLWLYFFWGYDEIINEPIVDILTEYSKSSFVVQELVKPHVELRTLYPDAVNTFRIVTYIWNGKIFHWPITLRLGQGGIF
ncbi:MAG: hypothetical protein J6L77_10225 [Coprococcus sp.]|nr:hypothetical protein [Coprococcus sp.]